MDVIESIDAVILTCNTERILWQFLPHLAW